MRQRSLMIEHRAEIAHIKPATACGRLVRWLFAAILQRNRIEGDNSVLQQLFDSLVELFERDCAFDPLAIDEEGRRRIDLQHLVGELFIGR